MRRKEWGFTLIEVAVVTGLVAMLMPAIGLVFYQVMRVPPQEINELTAIDEVRNAAYWIGMDGMRAEEFSPSSEPVYGNFSWVDYSSAVIYEHEVEYRWEDGKLIRKETVTPEGSASQTTEITIARNIGNYSDVEFAYEDSHLDIIVKSIVGGQSKELILYISPRIFYLEEE